MLIFFFWGGGCIHLTPTTPMNLSHTERQSCQTWWAISGDGVQPSRASTKLSLLCVCVSTSSLESGGGTEGDTVIHTVDED